MTEKSPAEAVFFAAAALPAAERAAYLARACADRDDLRQRVEQMLAAQPLVGSFLEPPAKASDATSTHAPGRRSETEDYGDSTARVGSVLAGKYKLVEEIGAGGMGSVYMAQQTEPVKRAVAVKVIKAGMDSKAVLARFEAERQALALMDHPNIARVLDAGTTEGGRPFFVMELVKGTPITHHCDQHRLTARQRLELFVPVCQAIQYAHQKGVIHRDIKPSNVLVALYDDRPVPKVIDFGVAKAAGQALTDKTLMTGFGAVVGTPEYMSPEQASLNNLDIDTRSDVYSLGVLLYELLTGTTPMDRKSLQNGALMEVLRIVREVEAPRPSAKLSTIATLPSVAANRGTEPGKLATLLRGELDWVVLKALEKEKARLDEAERVKERDRANDELKHRLGVSAMVLANAAFEDRDYKLAADRLDAVPAGQRGWEWHFLKRQLRGGIFTLYGHNAPVRSIAVSPDGTWIVTAAGGGQHEPAVEAKVWDARTGAHLLDLKGGGTAVAFSPDGTRILTTGGHPKPRVWDATTRALRLEPSEPAFKPNEPGAMRCAAFSPDGTRIATASLVGFAGIVRVWDARTGESVCHWRADRVTLLAFTPDGTRLLTYGQDGSAKVWDAKTGTILLEAKGLMLSGNCMAFSPDATRIAVGREDGTAQVIDARTGESLLVLRVRPQVWQAVRFPPCGVLSVAFSPDGTRIVTAGTSDGASTGEASVWDARTGAELLELKGHTGPVVSASFSHDGQRIVTGGSDGTVKVWDARTGTPRLELAEVSSPVACAAMSADGQWTVTGGGRYQQPGEATVWDARTGLPRFSLKGLKGIGPVHAVAISRDGTRIVTGGGTAAGVYAPLDRGFPELLPEAVVWDARTGWPLFELKGLRETVGSVSISPDGTRIVTAGFFEPGKGGSAGSELKVWDASNGTLLHDLITPVPHMPFRFGERGGSVAFSPDGTRFVTGGLRHTKTRGGGELKVWDAVTGKPLVTLKGNDNSVLGVAFSPDGTRIATANDDKTATVRDAATGAVLVELKGHTGGVTSVAFSPDGTRIATGGNDRTVRVWDARTGTTVAELKSLTNAVTSVSFSADGSQILASAGIPDGNAGEVVVWDAPTRTPEVELAGYTGVIRTAVFSPAGAQVVTVSGDWRVRVWEARTGNTIRELEGANPGADLVAVSTDGTRIATSTGPSRVTGVVKVWDARTGAELIEFKTGSITSLAFAVDGTRIVTNEGLVWDARTGLELKGEAIPKTVRCEGTSPDGRFSVRLRAGRAEVAPLLPDSEEVAYRRLHTAPKPARYRAGYLAARTARDDFAAAFYLDLLSPAERKAVVEQGDADAFAALNARALEHLQTAKPDEAIPLLVEILKVNQAKLGLENPATIEAANALVDSYFKTGQPGKAIPVLDDLVTVWKAKQSPHTHYLLGQLGRAYKDAGRLKEAIAVLEEVVAKDAAMRPQLLDVYALAGQHDKVVTVCREQLNQLPKEKDERAEAASKAAILPRLGRAYLAQKKWADAETQLRECVTIGEKLWPEGWRLFDTRSLLGDALSRQKKYSKGEPLLLKSYEGLKKMEYFLEPQHAACLPEALDRLIEFYTATNKTDEAKKWREERAKYPEAKNVAAPQKK